jgi:hypothetical protein
MACARMAFRLYCVHPLLRASILELQYSMPYALLCPMHSYALYPLCPMPYTSLCTIPLALPNTLVTSQAIHCVLLHERLQGFS